MVWFEVVKGKGVQVSNEVQDTSKQSLEANEDLVQGGIDTRK